MVYHDHVALLAAHSAHSGKKNMASLPGMQTSYFQDVDDALDDDNNNESPNRSFFKNVHGEMSAKNYLQGSDDDTVQSIVELTDEPNQLLHSKLIKEDISNQDIDFESDQEYINNIEGQENLEAKNNEGAVENADEDEQMSEQAEEEENEDDDKISNPDDEEER